MLSLQDGLLSNKIAKDAFYPGQKSLVSLISLVIAKKNHNIDELILAIDMLLSQQVVVTYTDLVTATRYHLPIEVLNNLYQSSDLTANEVFKKHGKYTSLALLSLSFKYAEAALYWHEMGSSFIPATIGLNGFDVLFHFGFDNKNTDHKKVFNIILNQEIIPFDPRTLNKARQQLTLEQHTALKEKFHNNIFGLSETELKQANEYVTEIHSLLLHNRVNFTINDPLASPCFTPLAKKLMANVIKPNKRKAAQKNNKKTALPEGYTKQLNTEQIEQQISNAKQLYANKADIENYLAINKNLNSKRTIEKYRQDYVAELSSNFNSEFQENLKSLESNTEALEMQQAMQQVMLLIQDKKLNEAIQLDSGLLSMFISTNLILHTDVNFIISLIERGGSLPKDTIWHLVKEGNLHAIKSFIPYGLQLNYIDPLERTVIQNSVAYKQLSILTYLLNNKLSTIESSLGFDALHIAIKDFDMANGGIAYISILIKYGAQIDNTHKHLMYEIKRKSSTEYDYIIKHHPDLAL